MTKRKYGGEEKQRAVETYLNNEASLSEIADIYEVSYSTVREWVRRYRSLGDDAFNM